MQTNTTGKKNYQKELEGILADLSKEGKKKTLLIHSCCAPCSSYCLEYLEKFFDITVYYYNPNITEKEEYEKRVAEQERLIVQMNEKNGSELKFARGMYEPLVYLERIRGLEECKEGGSRCEKCFRLRLEKTAQYAVEHGFDYYTTTLTISPLKNADLLNRLGTEIGAQNGIVFLPSDFKKKNGYQRSIELSKEYNLYRQDYCGCEFSKKERHG